MRLREYLTEAKKNWLDAAKWVVKNHQYVYIHPKTNDFYEGHDKKSGYIILDAVTAGMLTQIADALKDVKNREKFTSMPLLQAVDIGWKLVQRSKR